MSSRSKKKRQKREQQEKNLESLKSFYDNCISTLEQIKQDYTNGNLIIDQKAMKEDSI